MPAQAPRTCESRWRRTARAMGIARIAGVANASAPPGRQEPRNEVSQDDDVQPERAGRCLADRDGAVQLFVRQHSTRDDEVLSDDWNGRESAERQRRRSQQQQVQHDRVHGSVLKKAAPNPPATRRITNCGIGSSSVMTNVVTASATPRRRCC